MGLARINLDTGEARTAMPGIGSLNYFTLEFTAEGKTAVNKTLSGSKTITVALEPALWTLKVKGYTSSSSTDSPQVSGTVSVPITAGVAQSFSVSLVPEFTSGGTGSLSYSISLPGSVRAGIGLYPIDNTPGTSREIDISQNASGTLNDLAEGTYRAVIELYDANNKAAARTEVVHIYNGLTTPLNRSFSPANFYNCDPVVAGATLAAKLDAALASSSGAYTVVIEGTESDLYAFAPKNLNVTENKNITITIRGKGHNLPVSTPGTALFTVGADSGSSLTLVLYDLTLTGRNPNNAPVVQVNSGGTLRMKTGSLITGNTTTNPFSGGGVYVHGGTFTMSGGAVSGNTTNISNDGGGAGVYVHGGSFTMSGGAVSGNTSSASATPWGGGVYVDGGSFTMSGGAVSGNTTTTDSTSSSYGGGVYVNEGTFTMSGGAVTENTSSASQNSYGGGVSVNDDGAFMLSGGVVSGNITTSSSSARGGGVFVDYGTFTMSGGEVSGNTSSASQNSYGGGVFVDYGTFTLSGGTVNGNLASSRGGGVYIYCGTFNMSGGAVSENITSSGGVYITAKAGYYATFTMSDGVVSGNTSSSSGGGVYVSGGNGSSTFNMSGGAVSGNTSSSNGGGVYVSNGATFTMSGGAVQANILSGTGSYAKELLVGGTFKMSEEAQPERIFLNDNRFVTISGPLSGSSTPIDLGGSSSGYENKPILTLDSSYSSGDLASLKEYFTLGTFKLMYSPYTETDITGYKISDNGFFVTDE
jgi:hypothetical protein